MSISEKYIAELYNKIQEERPIIHCITNAVTVNDCANILLAAGASPTMAHHPLEVEEITAGTKALVCNFGAIADYEAMEKAGRVAGELGHAIVNAPSVPGFLNSFHGYRLDGCFRSASGTFLSDNSNRIPRQDQ